jgi:hypothetical protein
VFDKVIRNIAFYQSTDVVHYSARKPGKEILRARAVRTTGESPSKKPKAGQGGV